MIPASVRRHLEENHVPYRVVSHPPTVTAQETAQAAHIKGRRLAKTVLLRTLGDPERFLLAVLPASEYVDLARLSEIIGVGVTLATEAELNLLFPECEPGAAPPFGRLAGIPVVADACLSAEEWIATNGGTHADLIELKWADFQRLVRPVIVDYGRGTYERPESEALWPV